MSWFRRKSKTAWWDSPAAHQWAENRSRAMGYNREKEAGKAIPCALGGHSVNVWASEHEPYVCDDCTNDARQGWAFGWTRRMKIQAFATAVTPGLAAAIAHNAPDDRDTMSPGWHGY